MKIQNKELSYLTRSFLTLRVHHTIIEHYEPFLRLWRVCVTVYFRPSRL